MRPSKRIKYKRLSAKLVSVDFSTLFQGVISTLRILPPEKESKVGQNNPKTRRNPNSQIVSKTCRNIIFVILLCIPLVSFFYENDPPLQLYEGKDLSAILEMMPKKDKERLTYFFQKLIEWDAFGYVLFGEKPMSFGCSDQMGNPFRNLSSFYYAISPRRIKAQLGFETWKKYESLFPAKQFVFIYEKTESDIEFLFVNKKKFNETVKEHAEQFQRLLQRDVSGGELLAEAANRSLLSEVLGNHDELIGILFGFGQENASLFTQMVQLKTGQERELFCKQFNFGDPWEKEDEELDQELEKVGWISATITGAHLKNLNLITLPGFFAVLDSPETLFLKERYLQTRNKMIQYYDGKDFLEVTLHLLTAPALKNERSFGI